MLQGPKKQLNVNIEKKLLNIVHSILISLDKKRAADSLSSNSKISQDLGIDSLGRVELFHQIEEAFGVYLPQSLLVEAETLLDIALSLEHSTVKSDWTAPIDVVDHTRLKVDPKHCQSLVEILVKRGTQEATRVHIYYQDEKGVEHPITYGELLEQATRVAASFRELGLNPGEAVAIMLPTSKAFFYTFMGALLAGIVAVPIYPPIRPDKIEEYALREAIILKNAEVRLMVTFDKAEKLSSLLKVFIPSLKNVVTIETLLKGTNIAKRVPVQGNTSAFIQYTSGSTSDPKGVLLSHDNLLANIRAISEVINAQPGDVGVSWLPLYHDMGLIGCWLTSFYHAMPIIIMSPLTFLSRPERWLWTIHYHRGTLSAAPNFAYEMCVRKIKPQDIEGLDLSTWRLSFNGAEAINPATIERFNKKFGPHGLNSTTIYPAYGLAECAVGLALPTPGAKVIVDTISKEAFETEQKAVPLVGGASDATLQFVCEGRALPKHEIKIINDQGQDVSDRVIGRVIFKGPSMMQGYYRNPKATAQIMVGDYIDTGDYGYQVDGQIFITGRRKDIIIKAGRNYYPEEIEGIVAEIEGTRRGCIIAFGVTDKRLSTEKLVIVCEHKCQKKADELNLIQEVTERVNNAMGIAPDEVILIPAGTIPKTSSGKLQRSKCKQLVEQNKLKAKKIPMWVQVLRLSFKAGVTKTWQWLKIALRTLYSLYVFAVMTLLIPFMWLFTWVLPNKAGRAFLKGWARIALTVVGMPVKVIAKNPWPEKSTIFAANHASYIDAVVLLATLPSQALLVGKKEIFNYPFIGRIVKKLGVVSVDRYDFSKNLEDTKRMTDLVSKGQSIAIFPEGTFTYMAGIREFRLGAFKIAVDTNIGVTPLGLKGTRKIFRGNSLLLCPGQIELIIGSTILPQDEGWEEVTRLRRITRQVLSDTCAEPMVEF